jgi:hypothetical protein
MPGWLTNRFVVLAVVLVVGIGAWNLYLNAHAHGIVTGTVVDAAGRPVAGARVRMFGRSFVSEQEQAHTTTDTAGQFRFNDNASHVIQLQVELGQTHSARTTIRLWFRAQDVALATPLRAP